MRNLSPILPIWWAGTILFCFIALAACSFGMNKEYVYSEPKLVFSWGHIEGKLVGTYHVSEDEKILGSPYDFCWGVYMDKIQGGNVTVSNVEFHDVDTALSFKVDKVSQVKEITSDYNIPNHAIDCISNIELDYDNYNVTFELLIEADNQTVKEKVSLRFDKNYREYRSNKAIDFIRYF